MTTYYRFQNDQPHLGEKVHCFKDVSKFKEFCKYMKSQDPSFSRMKFWEIEGLFLKEDEGDAVVSVTHVKEIKL